MKKFIFVAVLVVIAITTSGFTGEPEAVTIKPVKVASGQNLWTIADTCYLDNAARGMCFEEYHYNLKQKNQHLKGRYLQPGDTVYVPCYVK